MSALVYPGQEQGAWDLLGDLRRRVASLEATPAGDTPTGFIAFNTDNEGGWLDITTNDKDAGGFGIHITDTTHDDGILVEQTGGGHIRFQNSTGTQISVDGTSNFGYGLQVTNIAGSQQELHGTVSTVQSLYAGPSHNNAYAVEGSSYITFGTAWGVVGRGQAGGSDPAFGGDFRGFMDGTGDAVGAHAEGDAHSGTGDYGIGIYASGVTSAADQVAGVGGMFAAVNGSADPTRATVLTHADPSTGAAAYARGSGVNAVGLMLDVHATSGGTAHLIRGWSGSGAGSEVLRVDADGTVHIKTGSVFVADL